MQKSNPKQLRSILALAVTMCIALMTVLVFTVTVSASPANSRSGNGALVVSHETETEHPRETETQHGERTGTAEPRETETHHPEGTETEHPRSTGTREPEETETVEPQETETHHPEGTETRHPEGTQTEHPRETETEHPRETGTPRPQGTPTVSGTASVPGTGNRVFRETGKAVSGTFLQYWDRNGGLQQQGFPISGMMQERSDLNGKSYVVQYFERSVMEYHPENKAPFDVLLSQLGTFQYKAKYPNGASGQRANTSAGSVLFRETGHRVGGRFLQYWQSHGGVAQQGYPISEEFTEKSALNGQTYTVQYFERSVMEYHPENKAPFDVLLSQLGTFQYRDKYGK